MKKNFASAITLLVLLTMGLTTSIGCDDATVRGGAKVVLENISIGSLSVEGKPLAGLPSQNVNVVLNVATNEVRVNSSGGKTTMKLNPSGATVVIGPEGTTFTGVKSDQVEIQWQTDTVTPTGVPVITSFTANPNTINAGQSATLQWNVTGASSISIAPGIGVVSSGTQLVSVSPAVTTTYILTATNNAGSVNAAATITVTSTTTGLPVITNFTGNPSTITAGQSSTLTWSITGATSISISPSIGVPSSSFGQQVSPVTTTTYSVTATNSSGSATASTTVIVR